MSEPKPPSLLPTSPSAAVSDRLALALLVLVVLVTAGCASGTADGSKGGMRAWADERGQVRYTTASRESSDASGEAGGKEESATSKVSRAGEPSHPEFNLEQYPDAGDQDSSRETEELFYSWRDAQGRVHNTPYLYGEEALGRVMREPEAAKVSEARVTTSGASAAPGFRQDSEAAAILGVGEGSGTRLDVFSQQCCGDLPRLDYQQLERERTLPVSLGDGADVFRFNTGASRFALVRLPPEPEQSLLRIRSFIRDGGFFLPNAVFLDGGFRPVRMVTDIVMEYSAETWRRYGHMEARLAIKPDSGERWLVLFTRSEDLESATRVGQEGQRLRLTHEPVGSLSLRLVD
ncbi:MalM family protein [Vreelandella utahensis]|uniref:MalM family protein n=1 Tax=Vreelandella halophila TaxID=86177 RepID=UPI000984160A|nr:MalM family protein [Halomonas utahensis]